MPRVEAIKCDVCGRVVEESMGFERVIAYASEPATADGAHQDRDTAIDLCDRCMCDFMSWTRNRAFVERHTGHANEGKRPSIAGFEYDV